MSTAPVWTPTEGATETERDQEIDLGDGWHAIVGPHHGAVWSWEVWSTWLHDDESNIVASGCAFTEQGAKNMALAACNSRPNPAPAVHDIAGPSNSIDFGGYFVAMTPGGVDFHSNNSTFPNFRLQMADLQPTLNWLARHGYVGQP